jgi:cytoskeletal protein CcmA (bactofilin family)
MFTSKTNNNAKETGTGLATIIAAGTEIKGNIESKGDIRVDGTLIGNLQTSSKVLIGPGGHVQGDVDAQQAEVLGRVTGNVKVAELLFLKGNCEINGNIYTGQLQVDATASFNGECHMGTASKTANVVTIQTEELNVASGFQ